MKITVTGLLGLLLWVGCAGEETSVAPDARVLTEEELPFEQWYPGAGVPDASEAEQSTGSSEGNGEGTVDDGGDESAGSGVTGGSTEETLGECTDGFDNNNNGAADCDDPGCAWTPDCQVLEEEEPVEGANPGECSDLQDNDGDGVFDCNDPDCKGAETCVFEGDAPGECSDGADNDQDGLYDCDDPNCFNAPGCEGSEGNTGDSGGQGSDEGGQDPGDEGGQNTGDGGGQSGGDEGGQNGDEGGQSGGDESDENGDEGGEPVSPENTETACSDGEDNDGDGEVDCADYECTNFEICDGMTCSASGPVTCGSTVEGNTEDGIANISFYTCENSDYSSKSKNTFAYHGPEVVYSFKASQDWFVSVELSSPINEITPFVLEDTCNGEYSCYATTTSASNFVEFPTEAGTTYYIVIDGFSTKSGSYKLDISCIPPGAE